jgi:hypothetical protein
MTKNYLLVLGGFTAISVVVVLMLLQVRSVRSERQPTPTPNALTPFDESLLPVMPTAIQPTVVDLAPHISDDDKPSVVVQHPDGSRTMFLVAADEVDPFIKNLPKGDKVVGVIPAPSVLAASGEPDTPEP